MIAGRDRRRDLRDGTVLAALTLSGLAISWVSGCPWLVANLLILGLPLGYLLWTSAETRRRLDVKFVLLFALFGTVVFDSLARRTGAWGGPTALPFLLPGEVSLEELQWILLYFPLAIAINERFFAPAEVAARRRVSKPFLKAGFYLGIALACLPVAWLPLDRLPYLTIGSVLYLPALAVGLFVQRGLWRELVAIGVVTGLLNLGFEIVALEHGYWTFPGEYLGWVRLGDAAFPVEELFFLVLASGPSLVATYAVAKNWRRRPVPVEAAA